MNINEILENEKLSKLLNDSIGKTYFKFGLRFIIEQEDFENEVKIDLLKHLKKFDSDRASINTYIPLVAMSTARHIITLANGQSKDKNKNKLKFERGLLRLDKPVENSDNGASLKDSVTCEKVMIEDSTLTKIFIDEIVSYKGLTDIQKEILSLMREGLNKEEISRELNKTSSFVNYQFKKAKEKIVRKFEI